MKKLATPKIHALRLKLVTLTERGVNGERDAAKLKLSRLNRRYDFTKENKGGADIFDGVFIRSTVAAPVFDFDPQDFDIANAVKWGIEQAAKIECIFRTGGQLCAKADVRTAQRLHDIAGTLMQNFRALWNKYEATPGANKADRSNFILGLYEGMMNEARHNEALPRRANIKQPKRPRKRDLAMPKGISMHPYSIAIDLGKQVRCCITLDEISAELEQKIKGEIEA